VNNPNPTTRARRVERRRKALGSDNPRCFDCGESDLFCLELDHPVTEQLDKTFKTVRCRNCHRKREFERDCARLTKNGQHEAEESFPANLTRYMDLLALEHDAATRTLLAGVASSEEVAMVLQAAAASLRRYATRLKSSASIPLQVSS
jgi:hypothetical protein